MRAVHALVEIRQRPLLGAQPHPEQPALSTVKTTAVTHAVCTSGKATPSATTAT